MAVTRYTIEAYVGRPVDWKNNEVTMMDDGDGVYIQIWGVPGKTKPTDAQLATHDAAEAAAKAVEVVHQARRDAYPSAGDQLDMLWHAIDGDATLKSNYADFHTALKTVKDANPKD